MPAHAINLCCTGCRLLQTPGRRCAQCGLELADEAIPATSRHGWLATGGVTGAVGVMAVLGEAMTLGTGTLVIAACAAGGALLAKPIERLGMAARARWPTSLLTLIQHAYVPPRLADAHQEVIGRATPIDALLEAPLAGLRVIAYELRIWLHGQLVLRVARAVPFWLLGASGARVHVSGEVRVVEGGETRGTWFDHHRAFALPPWLRIPAHAEVEELRVMPGDRLRVMGVVRRHECGADYRDSRTDAIEGIVGAIAHVARAR